MTLEQSEVLRLQIRSKNVLSSDETELFELTQLAGLKMDPSVFKYVKHFQLLGSCFTLYFFIILIDFKSK